MVFLSAGSRDAGGMLLALQVPALKPSEHHNADPAGPVGLQKECFLNCRSQCKPSEHRNADQLDLLAYRRNASCSRNSMNLRYNNYVNS